MFLDIYRVVHLLGVFYSSQCDFKVQAYSDVDWGTCIDTRRSLTGFCVFLGSGLLSWKCKKQPTVVASSAEAEYRAMSLTTRELVWISHLLNDFTRELVWISDFQITVQLPFPLFC